MDNAHHLAQMLRTEMQERERVRIVLRLAEAIRVGMQIQDGVHLVAIIGNGDERDNREALRTWVAQVLYENEESTARRLLPLMMGRLEKELSEYQGVGC